MSPARSAQLGCNTPAGAALYARRQGWRAAGYSGPLDEHGQIPNPDDPANADMIATYERMRSR